MTEGIEYIKGEMRMNKIKELAGELLPYMAATHDKCPGCTLMRTCWVQKCSPDHPYCFTCTVERRPHLIDGRDFEAVRTALNNHLKDKSQHDVFGLMFGLDKPLPLSDVGIAFCPTCKDMSRFENGVCVECRS